MPVQTYSLNATSSLQVCMAEDVCISKSCGKAYEHTATNFPFSISYEKSRNSGSTTFDFKVRLSHGHGQITLHAWANQIHLRIQSACRKQVV